MTAGVIIPVYLDPDLCTRFEGAGVVLETLSLYPIGGLEKVRVRMIGGQKRDVWVKKEGGN